MKRLMLLGGSKYQLPVIETAHDLGYYVITCDYLPNNIAHKYSDEYCNVSIIDKDAVLEAAQKLKINGIMSFACDPGVTTAAYVAEKMGLPSVGSYESVCILQNKGKFRRFLAENGFNVPRARQYKDRKDALNDASTYQYPVIVKPTDSAGSKGVSRVDTYSEFTAAIDYAFEKSISGEIIVEEFLEKVGCSSDSECFSVDGELKFVSFSAQRFDVKAKNPYTPAAFSWPSTLSAEHERELTREIQRLISLLGLKTSIYNVETRECTDGKAYIMEISPRGGGNRLAEMLKYATGVDLIKAAVLAAVGESLNEVTQSDYRGHWAEVILHAKETSIFESLWINSAILKNVVETDLWVTKGDPIYSFDGANHSIGTLVLHFDNMNEMEKTICDINDFVKLSTTVMKNDYELNLHKGSDK